MKKIKLLIISAFMLVSLTSVNASWTYTRSITGAHNTGSWLNETGYQHLSNSGIDAATIIVKTNANVYNYGQSKASITATLHESNDPTIRGQVSAQSYADYLHINDEDSDKYYFRANGSPINRIAYTTNIFCSSSNAAIVSLTITY